MPTGVAALKEKAVYTKVTIVLENKDSTTTLEFFNVPIMEDAPKEALPVSQRDKHIKFDFEYLRTPGTYLYYTSKTEPKSVAGVVIE